MQPSNSAAPLRARSRPVTWLVSAGPRLRWFASRRAIVALGLGALLIVGAGFAALAESNRHAALRDGAARVQAIADGLAEQSLRLLELGDVVATQAAALTANRTWPEIGAARDLFATLQRVAQQYPHVDAIWLADESGLPRLSSRGFPPRAESVVGDQAFAAHGKQDGGAIVSRIVERRTVSDAGSDGARDTRQSVLALTRRITATDGSFGGIVAVAMDPAVVLRPPIAAPFAVTTALAATDGRTLLSSDRQVDEALDAGQAPAAAVADDDRIIATARAGDRLVAVAAAARADILADWRWTTLRDGALLALALLFIGLFAAIAAARAAGEARLRRELSA